MNFDHLPRFLAMLTSVILIQGCVEPFDFETETFDSVLVIEATLTNEHKQQEMELSKTYRLEEEGPSAESNAVVTVMDDQQNEYLFQETSPGTYTSLTQFKAEPGRSYRLDILTQDGRNYISDPAQLIEGGQLDDLRVVKTIHENRTGVALQIDSYNSRDLSGFYKFDYEETFKIVSPYRSDTDLVVIDGRYVKVPKTKEETTCYRTDPSDEIILANTNSLDENILEGFLIKFLDRENPILARRYSILVEQYALSAEAYSYFQTLKKLSGSESLFSQNQPGFIQGNIYAPNNPREKVIGFFNISSVSRERIFFSFEDFFDPLEGRPSLVECNPYNPRLTPGFMALVESGRIKFVRGTVPTTEDEGPYVVVEAECMDCTLLGSSKVPEFWQE